MIGKAICWLLRKHRWRRPYKSELWDGETRAVAIFHNGHRICSRCGAVREVRRRK